MFVMKKQHNNPTDKEIMKAREVNRAFYSPEGIFYNKDINKLTLRERRNLVSMFYGDIRGVPIEKVPSKQIYPISEGVYSKAMDFVDQYGVDEYEGRLLDSIRKLENTSDEEERYSLVERLSLELEDKPLTRVSIRFRNSLSKLFFPSDEETRF